MSDTWSHHQNFTALARSGDIGFLPGAEIDRNHLQNRQLEDAL
jgi:hypothetical protein